VPALLQIASLQYRAAADHPRRAPETDRAIEEQKEKLEAEISSRSDVFRAQVQPITVEAVQSAIPTDAALIEFFSYHPFNTKFTKPVEAFSQPHYVAYALRRQGAPQGVELGEAEEIDEAVTALRQALGDPKRADVKRLARQVDKRVMQPVRALLGDTRRALISPDGSVNLVPFAALVDERNNYLVTR
jgi:CHAT domain-containing protein